MFSKVLNGEKQFKIVLIKFYFFSDIILLLNFEKKAKKVLLNQQNIKKTHFIRMYKNGTKFKQEELNIFMENLGNELKTWIDNKNYMEAYFKNSFSYMPESIKKLYNVIIKLLNQISSNNKVIFNLENIINEINDNIESLNNKLTHYLEIVMEIKVIKEKKKDKIFFNLLSVILHDVISPIKIFLDVQEIKNEGKNSSVINDKSVYYKLKNMYKEIYRIRNKRIYKDVQLQKIWEIFFGFNWHKKNFSVKKFKKKINFIIDSYNYILNDN